MNIIIAQPKQENNYRDLLNHFNYATENDILFFPEGYIKNYESVLELAQLARKYKLSIVSGYLDDNTKDRAVIIDSKGRIVLDRQKKLGLQNH